MSQRKVATKKKAQAYRGCGSGGRARILDELVQLTGWHRHHACAALRDAL